MKTKYLFIGNMNNMCYMFAREMKNHGHDVTLWINAPKHYKLDRPEAFDSTLSYPYPNWIVEMTPKERINVTHLPILFFIAHRYLKMINQFDVIILNGNWTSLAKYIPKDKQIIGIFAGDDLGIYSNPKKAHYLANHIVKKNIFLKLFYPIFFLSAKYIISERRQAIKRMDKINYYPTGIDPITDKVLEKLMKGKKYKRLNLRGIPLDEIIYTDTSENSKFNILNFTRFIFKDNVKSFSKRNDIMILGISDFINTNNLSPTEIEIIFFEKGEDVNAAKMLISELKIDQFVSWTKPVSQTELHKYIEKCNVCFDQLGEQWVGYGIVAMAMGRPLIANGRPEIFEKFIKEKSPICQARTSEEVSEWLTKLYSNHTLQKIIGKKSSEYTRKYYDVNRTIEFITS